MTKKLLFQIGTMLAVFFFTLLILLGIVISAASISLFLNAKNEMIDRDLLRMKESVMITDALSSMLDYWKDNSESVLIKYTEEEMNAVNALYEKNIYNYNDSDFAALSDAAKSGLAKDEYNALYNRINNEASSLDYKNIYLMDIREDSMGFIYCIGEINFETDDRALGQSKEIDVSRHPAITRILSGIYGTTEYEIFEAPDGNSLYIGYAPIESDGVIKCAVCVEYDWSPFRKSLVENLIVLAIIILILSALYVAVLLNSLRRRTITPITRMQKSVMEYIETKNSSDVINDMNSIKADNEIGLFAMNISALATEMDSYISEIKQSQEAIENLNSETMEALAKAIDAKDEYTNDHSERVAIYSRMIAKKMGLSAKELKKIYYMGLLHDIGKIGIPGSIINKASKLTDEELGLIRSHPILGYNILEKIHSEPDLAYGARWHHEFYNGKGYPDGKKGDEIPLLVRIIAVADSYDAMTSNRSYRSYLPQDVARAEIEKGVGTQFDPDVAECMLEIIDADKQYALHQ